MGCTKNCYDFKPRAAWQADMADPDPKWSAPRMLFTAALPGFILGFFTLRLQGASMPGKYTLLVLFVLVSIGLFGVSSTRAASRDSCRVIIVPRLPHLPQTTVPQQIDERLRGRIHAGVVVGRHEVEQETADDSQPEPRKGRVGRAAGH